MSTHRPPRVHPVVTRIIDVADVIERLDPRRHLPEPEYQFSNGRTFIKHEGTEYR